jgi:hypothetical protein
MSEAAIEIHSTRAFEDDLARLPEAERARVVEKVNVAASLLKTDRRAFFQRVQRPAVFRVGGAFESSLYVLRPLPRLRVILAADEDPVFGRSILTLLRLVPTESLEKELAKVARRLYRDLGAVARVAGERGNGRR